MRAKTLGGGKGTGHELGNLSCAPPGQNPAVMGKQDLWGEKRKGGPGFGAGQERLGPSCSGHGMFKAWGLKNHAQTASGLSASLISMLF
jgi:hypothetical protein